MMLRSTDLPAHVRGTMLAMSMDVGRIAEDKQGDRVRVFLDFGRRRGKYVRLYSIPGPAGKRIVLDRRTAEYALHEVRRDLANGRTLEQALAPFRGETAHEHQLGAHLSRWIDERRRRLAAGGEDAPSPRSVSLYATYDRKYFRPWWE